MNPKLNRVRVELENGLFTHYSYNDQCTTYKLVQVVCGKIYGEALEAYVQFGEIGVYEVCHEGISRRTRSYERVSEIVSTWPPSSRSYLKLRQCPETIQCNPNMTRLCGLQAMYSLLHQDWVPCTIDIFDKLFYLRSKEYNGLWRSSGLEDVDVYDSSNSDVVVLRSQVAYESLPDKVDRMLVIKTSPAQALELRTLVYTLRTQRLMNPKQASPNLSQCSAIIGPPPTVTLLAPGPIKGVFPSPQLLTPPSSPADDTNNPLNSAQAQQSLAISLPQVVPQHQTMDQRPPPGPQTVKPHQGSQTQPIPPQRPPRPDESPCISDELPPPVPPKDKRAKKKSKKSAKTFRRHCPVIEGRLAPMAYT